MSETGNAGELVLVVGLHHDGSRRVELVRPVKQPFGFGGWPVTSYRTRRRHTEFLQRVEAEALDRYPAAATRQPRHQTQRQALRDSHPLLA
jgi:hypothetical protein